MNITRIEDKCNEVVVELESSDVIKLGFKVRHMSRILNFKIISINDDVFYSRNADVSAQKMKEILNMHFCATTYKLHIDYKSIPQSGEQLKNEIQNDIKEGYDGIFTIGGTGVSARDITYEVVNAFCEKKIPGLMEYIRVKFGEENPHALLSRSIAGINGSTLIYTIPGSKKAVIEYMEILLKTMEHIIHINNGLGH
ncbi:MogA/MoaB family molybdenum cofactor biosynthesis protein [Clostridium acetobutylicum]|uniref:Molybdenum cofactor biosynthesis protein B n=2 Tax=Clostridiaceae TaxID=31979 RepID=Q97HL7_CLOAB|nr:molybdenum cofactor biosynthesis protein B [Clostridium acetobutylicum]PSM07575.1 molybdenum cofactor biosynthesis protein MoaB [Clostridium sp. NJ4]AAK79953.1 Molybdopterin biosynthesis enzyme, MoaB [Clostridium acetobutylicum ATCC 824]AEI34458.1 molybdopterin biosynthesis protein MoaB [Clostridium acetobutylicum DSM 1731]AWV79615.1 molybdenum cofactor biosynthesis protein MoaB [Clostridium acetobutylicum]MBC2394412.1 molybdenum cofactor biosynthesis protein MoaB [Clostridium acetobutylicu